MYEEISLTVSTTGCKRHLVVKSNFIREEGGCLVDPGRYTVYETFNPQAGLTDEEVWDYRDANPNWRADYDDDALVLLGQIQVNKDKLEWDGNPGELPEATMRQIVNEWVNYDEPDLIMAFSVPSDYKVPFDTDEGLQQDGSYCFLTTYKRTIILATIALEDNSYVVTVGQELVGCWNKDLTMRLDCLDDSADSSELKAEIEQHITEQGYGR